MATGTNDLHVRQMLGELLAGQKSLDSKIDSKIDAVTQLNVSHNAEADRRWDRLDAELRNIKHDQRNVEQRTISLSESIKHIALRHFRNHDRAAVPVVFRAEGY
jgi:hypothetical protein